MRVRCPTCKESFAAKANARRMKCPHCGFRQEVPEGGLADPPAAWRKENPERFTVVTATPAPRPRSTDPRLVLGALAVAALAIAGWWVLRDTPLGEPAAACADVANAEPAPPGGIELDLITPGVWNVCSENESMYVWLHNNGTDALDYVWSVTGPDGSPLPEGWAVVFAEPNGTLPAGEPGARDPATWTATLATLTIPADQGEEDVAAELHAGGATRSFVFRVQALGAVTRPGDRIETCYDLRGQDGRAIQKGPFPLNVAGPGAVPGYAFGVAGIAPGETVELVVPPPFAYGAEGRPGIHPWETLTWSATYKQSPAPCPT